MTKGRRSASLSFDELSAVSAKESTLQFLVVLEFMAIAGWLVMVWRRSRPADPPYTGPILLLFAGLVVQALALVPAYYLLGWISAEEGIIKGRIGGASFGLLVIQLVRVVVAGLALAWWLRIVKPSLTRNWKGVMIAIACIVAALSERDGVRIIAFVVAFIPLWRLRWTNELHGWSRLGMLFLALIVWLVASFETTAVVSDGAVSDPTFGFTTGSSSQILGGDVSGFAGALLQLAYPAGYLANLIVFLLAEQALVVFIKMLVLPIHLRGLSLKRRFTVTYVMFRLIPGFLGIVILIAGVYIGIGMHRSSVARGAFRETSERNLIAARQVLEAGSLDAFEPTLPWLSEGGASGAVCVMRVVSLESDGTVDTTLTAEATGVVPPALLTETFHDAGERESTTGFAERGGILYLGGAAAQGAGSTATVAEVYVPVDTLYLNYVARRTLADLRVNVRPGIMVGPSEVTIGSTESAWTDSTYSIWGEREVESERGFFEKPLFLTRTFLTVGDWRSPTSGAESAVELTLYASIEEMIGGDSTDAYFFASNAIAIAIFVGLILIIAIVEFSAARTGRSIIRGIVADARDLARAAEKFGDGDLSQRIEVRGKDELGRLGETFNRMAKNIGEHQAVLLEKERLEADLKLAREIQQRLLPQSPPVVAGLDAAGVSIPSREVGGDLFYFLPVPDGKLGLTIGDVSGKSVPAALLMSTVLAALKAEVRLVREEDQILEHLNRLISDQVEPGRFVTFFYGVVDTGRGTLRYACAGHNPPLLMRADGDSEWLSESGVPLGVVADSTYRPREISLNEGDVVVLYSDGVTEAHRPGVQGKEDDDVPAEPAFFDEHRLESVVRDARSRSAASIVESIVSAVNDFTGGSDLSDDLTLVVVKVSAKGTPA